MEKATGQYSSQYYDPQKAHEYYEKHKQLKGRNTRTSTAGLNEAGKIASKQVREAIKEERKAYNEKIKEEMKGKIEQLRNMLKGMSKEERKRRREEIMGKIKGLREENKAKREEAKAMFAEKFAQEMDKIKSSPEFQGKKGKKKK